MTDQFTPPTGYFKGLYAGKTTKAFCFHIDGKAYWLPKTQCWDTGVLGLFAAPLWLLKKNQIPTLPDDHELIVKLKTLKEK